MITHLDYYSPPTAKLTLTAHDLHPLLVLEDFDNVWLDVKCSQGSETTTGTVELLFDDQAIYERARDAWAPFSSLMVITAHPGCNTEHERGAWM